jgi:exoribonuclease R
MNETPVRQIDLQAVAKQVMLENGFEPEFSPQVQQQLGELKAHPPRVEPSPDIRDLRNLLWPSIDNDTSRDLDQAEVAEQLPNGETNVLVGIANVDTFVPKASAIDARAAKQGEQLPASPDSKALNDFLIKRKAADPDHFADLSLAVIKLMGPGEYVLERPGDPEQGHFDLAVQDYTHSTAPNRRFADLVTQRLIKAVLASQSAPYSNDELTAIALNCTLKEDAARKVEREMPKRIAAVAMSSRIGETFDAIVTRVTSHGTFVRVLKPTVEGLLAQGQQGADVGDKLRVKLIRTDTQRGYVDFARD